MLIRTHNKFAGLMLLLAPLLASASQNTERFAISTQQVAEALASAGLTARVGQVEILSEVSAASRHALLQVVGTANRAVGDAVVKLRCRDNQECLPFYVLVHASPAKLLNSGAGGTRLQPVSDQKPLDVNASFPRVVRGGDAATLILQDADYRISLPVVCLQDGARGQKIRVASKDHRRFFEGEVVGTGMLKGSL
ncbi:MAG: flagella basal body P-ring formation protein FlgA [Terriglobales bacterium]